MQRTWMSVFVLVVMLAWTCVPGWCADNCNQAGISRPSPTAMVALPSEGKLVTQPYRGVTYIDYRGTVPRRVHMHIIQIDLTTPGIGFLVTPYNPRSGKATMKETSLQFLKAHKQEGARIAVNAHFFEPWPASSPDPGSADLVGLAASSATVNGPGAVHGAPHAYSPFSSNPPKSYAIMANAPALNIDASNRATIVHRQGGDTTGYATEEGVALYNTVAGCAQIITNGTDTTPQLDWHVKPLKPRTVAGLSKDEKTLTLFTVDGAGGSLGMTVNEVASFLLADPAGLWPPGRRVHNAICLDDGGSTTLAMVDPATGEASVFNAPSGGSPRAVGSNLAILIPASYSDGRSAAKYRLDAQDYGVVLRHGDGPGQCDILGARDVWVFEADGAYYMHYDAAGPKGWLAALATSKDMIHWQKKGPVLELGKAGKNDSASASYGTTFYDGRAWHMFYLGTPHTSPAPDLVPAFPYLTMKARSMSPVGPWAKQKDVVPFQAKPSTYYSVTASPGQIIKQGDEYLMFFSAATDHPIRRTLSIARTKNLDGPWTLDTEPILPTAEQVENSALYFEPTNRTWFLFTNHVGVDGFEYTDAVWVYWSKDLNCWDPAHKAVVLDRSNCTWSKHIIGLPSVVRVGDRLALFYDGNGDAKMPGGVKSHMNRDIGLAWLRLPLVPPSDER